MTSKPRTSETLQNFESKPKTLFLSLDFFFTLTSAFACDGIVSGDSGDSETSLRVERTVFASPPFSKFSFHSGFLHAIFTLKVCLCCLERCRVFPIVHEAYPPSLAIKEASGLYQNEVMFKLGRPMGSHAKNPSAQVGTLQDH